MHLEKIEIQGFKSFAKRTVIALPARPAGGEGGIIAIVGPNGAGKSNIADAIRWVLGEQSLKLLRGKKSEDVIFAGSSKHPRLGAAEVVLSLNNEAHRLNVDYSHIELARRVFRNNESEYLLNGGQIRLADIHLLLAQAGIGQRTYSVIGQGMADAILAAAPAERKNFFDEATGVKQYQIKREQAQQKIEKVSANLNQVEISLRETGPRLKFLERQQKQLEKRVELETKLHQLQREYYGSRFSRIAREAKKYREENRKFASEHLSLVKKLQDLQNKFKKLERAYQSPPAPSVGKADAGKTKKPLAKLIGEQIAFLKKLLTTKSLDDLQKLQEEAGRLMTQLVESQEMVEKLAAEPAKSEPPPNETGQIFKWQREYQAVQAELNKLSAEKNKIAVELASASAHLADLEQEMTRELPAELRTIIINGYHAPVNEEEIWPKIARVKRELEAIGGIEPGAAKEYQETKERYDFLQTQASDLKTGLEKTKALAQELDKTISREFNRNFTAIASAFSGYFAELFGGGKASLELRAESELGELTEEEAAGLSEEEKQALADRQKIGIAIKAVPPGKKLANINMLSGGERAMTAIALICAIIKANPAPFVVLDEVDAALDEANSVRFAAILEKLSRQTQFIAITHNRATMEKASVLYGVTMGDDGISKLLSVNLEKAASNAALTKMPA